MPNSRQKGAAAEREVIKKLQAVADDALGKGVLTLSRNLDQYQEGGSDIRVSHRDYDLFSFEIKRQEKEQLPAWWRQTVRQAALDGRTPVLIYRKSKRRWCVVTPGRLPACDTLLPCTISLDVFLKYYAGVLVCAKKGEIR